MPGYELGYGASDGGLPHLGRAYGRMLTAQHERAMRDESSSLTQPPTEPIGVYVLDVVVETEPDEDDEWNIERGRE